MKLQHNMGNKIIFSGIQPSGNLHIGNYIGALKQWKGIQDGSIASLFHGSIVNNANNGTIEQCNNELIFCIVDLHAITVYQDPKILREKTLEVTALYLACGIDPKKSRIFIQSDNPDHSYLAWIFDCVTPIGWMNRMTQFKDKSEKQKESTSVGLFNYPALMAADILLYDADLVPVGEDQKQHVELTRDIAEKFNRVYGETFKLPSAMIDKYAARIMSLQNPASKMSKSDADPSGTINLLDVPDEIVKKIKRAITDSGAEIKFSKDKPALSNLLLIYSQFSGKPISEIETQYKSIQGYAQFKEDLAQLVVEKLRSIQQKYHEIRNDTSFLQKILEEGKEFSISRSSKKIEKVKNLMGLAHK